MGAGHHHSHGGHNQGHSHSHSHSHGGEILGRLGLAFGLNLCFALIELVGGYFTNSVAVMSNALHDFGDAFAIGLAYALEKISHRASNKQYSYGYRRYSAASAVVTGMILVIGSLVILANAIPRLFHPETPQVEGMILLGVLGMSVNGFAMWKVSHGTSLSERMILWHLLEDVLGWAIVLTGAVLIKIFGWIQLDAILACGLSVWIAYNVIRNLREVLRVFLQVVPAHLNMDSLEGRIRQVEGVRGIHHSHLWSLDGEQHIFTTHLVVCADYTMAQIEALKKTVKDLLLKDQIFEATLEIEPEGADCADPKHSE